MDCYCDYDPADVYRASRQRARKAYRCYECGGAIAPGELYERVFAIFEGAGLVARTCLDCLEVRDGLAEMACFCWAHGGLAEAVDDQFREAEFAPGRRFGYLRLVAKHRRWGRVRPR